MGWTLGNSDTQTGPKLLGKSAKEMTPSLCARSQDNYPGHNSDNATPFLFSAVYYCQISVDNGGCVQEIRNRTTEQQAVYLVEKREDMAYFESVEHARVIQRRHCQHGHSELLPQHAARSAGQAAQEPGHGPTPSGAAPQVTMADVAQQGQQEKEGRTFVGPAHDPGHRLCVDGVRGKEQAGQQAPQAASQQQASQHGK